MEMRRRHHRDQLAETPGRSAGRLRPVPPANVAPPRWALWEEYLVKRTFLGSLGVALDDGAGGAT